MMNAQVAGAVAQGRLLLRERFVRVNRPVEPGRFSLDSAEGIKELRSLGDSAARHEEREIHSRFLNPGPASTFEPVYQLS